jgi:hypothetical protein
MTKQLDATSSLLERASASPDLHALHRCAAMGCSKPTMRGSSDGVSFTYCRTHVSFKARHGSTWRKSLNEGELKPYLRAAKRWLKVNAASPFVTMAESELRGLVNSAGPLIFAGLLRELTPNEKALQALARLRESGRPLAVVLEHVLAVMAAMRGLEGLPRDDDYNFCQIGKRVHRLAAGYKWDLTLPDGSQRRKMWHPEPRGQMLRHLAQMLLGVMRRAFAESDLKAITDDATKRKAKAKVGQ